MLLEHCPGGSLRDLCARQPDCRISEAKASWYFAQILQGVDFMHQKRYVHRDLKEENMLLTADDEASLGFPSSAAFFFGGGGQASSTVRSARMSMVTANRFGEVYSQRPENGHALHEFSPASNYAGVKTVTVKVEGKDEVVEIDPENGPVLWTVDGSRCFSYLTTCDPCFMGGGGNRQDKNWLHMTSTEQTIQIHLVAKINKRRKDMFAA
eukprot:symbB.v1.2.035610.t1/scaffold4839.1/size34051/3